ncbi:TPA: hypothetical protein JGA48_004696, partial [Salmonella enterica]|nr:hypothetical protein [Salmonella enterica]
MMTVKRMFMLLFRIVIVWPGGHDRPPVYKALLLNAADAWREVVVLQRRLEALSALPEKNLPRSW